ncbi:MAG: hypothetical protein PHT89_04575 [Lachnospiraceae bacterium]|nr:hypothetical protein [Lachnospiraceae bacterium]MDD3659980.1 hypothetical protein [Lachnospiraceae bacterium]
MNDTDQKANSSQSIILLEYLTQKIYLEVQTLLFQCQEYEQVECKLELEYKLASAQLHDDQKKGSGKLMSFCTTRIRY